MISPLTRRRTAAILGCVSARAVTAAPKLIKPIIMTRRLIILQCPEIAEQRITLGLIERFIGLARAVSFAAMPAYGHVDRRGAAVMQIAPLALERIEIDQRRRAPFLGLGKAIADLARQGRPHIMQEKIAEDRKRLAGGVRQAW